MRILKVFGLFGVLCINFNQFDTFAFKIRTDLDVVTRQCKHLENLTPLLRLKRHLFCDYDSTLHPNYPNTTNVTMILMPKLMDFGRDNGILSLHSWISLTWTDPQLAWTMSDYDEISFIQIRSSQTWVPDLGIQNSGDMSTNQHELPATDCLLYNSGLFSCVPAMKLISKCNPDYTYWPYAKFQCSVRFTSLLYTEKELNLLIDGKGINMDDYANNTIWDLKFINSTREVKKYKCCPNDSFPIINYNFLLTHYHHSKQYSSIAPAIALILLTLTVFCLDIKSIERMAVASLNLVCHMYSFYHAFWIIPFNSVNTPNILLFYHESLALATFAILLTAFLRKLEDTSTEIPKWISFTTTLVLSNRIGRFLIVKDEYKIADRDNVTEENSDIPRSEPSMKESSWKYLVAIIDWLSFVCVIFIYVISLIILLPKD
ncbi:PREDICTED: neuronal acetylcholine receptor subunit alpha-2-like [Vollenhovia emeryi]|uniref:neuronal acetylcholine receptor subunit alpha-2-like n=1 Tax=Vollenhovia emeryi TaxID=411798 RepID=UPI0005F4AF92|nr:PREDICTED: neuronal acetylcholine receptor subunit alpha-2-like [Vollenhovia emeryi]